MKVFKIALFVVLLFTGSVAISGGCYDNNYGCDYGYGYDCGYGGGYGCGYDCGYGCGYDCGYGCDIEMGEMGLQEVEVHGHKNGRVTHGFEIHCGYPPPEPNNLEINWAGHRFHLSELSRGICIDTSGFDEKPPVAGFDTFIGTGFGYVDGDVLAWIKFTFRDAGEPGTEDTMKVSIFPIDSYDGLFVGTTNLMFGNHQAHKYNK
jgi:hypothetical protein